MFSLLVGRNKLGRMGKIDYFLFIGINKSQVILINPSWMDEMFQFRCIFITC